MKAGTVVLFTLFLPVLAGPPVEAAESIRGVPYGRIIWYWLNGLYDWYQAQRLAPPFAPPYSPPCLALSETTSALWQDYNMQEIKRMIKEFESTYEIKLEDLLELGELHEQQHHLKAEEFKNFISTFEEFKNFVSTFEDAYDFEIFLENYTQEAKATVKAMKAVKEKNSPMAPMAPMALDSLDSLDSPMDSPNSPNSSMAVESTKRQRSIIFGLTTLTIFAGLALLLFWILEEQKKKSRTNIKA